MQLLVTNSTAKWPGVSPQWTIYNGDAQNSPLSCTVAPNVLQKRTTFCTSSLPRQSEQNLRLFRLLSFQEVRDILHAVLQGQAIFHSFLPRLVEQSNKHAECRKPWCKNPEPLLPKQRREWITFLRPAPPWKLCKHRGFPSIDSKTKKISRQYPLLLLESIAGWGSCGRCGPASSEPAKGAMQRRGPRWLIACRSPSYCVKCPPLAFIAQRGLFSSVYPFASWEH